MLRSLVNGVLSSRGGRSRGGYGGGTTSGHAGGLGGGLGGASRGGGASSAIGMASRLLRRR